MRARADDETRAITHKDARRIGVKTTDFLPSARGQTLRLRRSLESIISGRCDNAYGRRYVATGLVA